MIYGRLPQTEIKVFPNDGADCPASGSDRSFQLVHPTIVPEEGFPREKGGKP